MKKLIGLLCIIIGLFILLGVWYMNSTVSTTTRLFSSYTLLTSSWENYKKEFISPDGRVIDKTQNNITTSEGQSYALLRSVWTDDKKTFDTVWNWTEINLKRKDNLFGWRWGNINTSSYGFLQNGGENSASDADEDIALANLLAARRWHNTTYQQHALPIIKAIFSKETTIANAKRYLVAGNWSQDQQQLVINVSYFAPYAWRMFAAVDKNDDWNALIEPAYQLLQDAGFASLDVSTGSGLPPNWIAIDRENGDIHATTIANFTTDYSYDAIRTPWRIALDYQWNKSPQAYSYLKNNFLTLINAYKKQQKLVDDYTHSGIANSSHEDPAMYATALYAFKVVSKPLAQKVYQDKILQLYSNDQNTFNKNLPYYEQNWLWFGAALYNNYLSNFK